MSNCRAIVSVTRWPGEIRPAAQARSTRGSLQGIHTQAFACAGTGVQLVSRQELFRTVEPGNSACPPPGTSFPSGVAFEVAIAYSGLRAAGGRKDCGSVFCSQTGTGRVFDSSGRATEGQTRGRSCVRGSSYLIPPPFQIKDFADAVGPGGPSRRPFVCGFPDPAAPPRGARSGTWRGEPSPQGSFPVRSTHHHQKEPA